jgi:hypothetical protein
MGNAPPALTIFMMALPNIVAIRPEYFHDSQAGLWTLDSGPWTLDPGLWTRDFRAFSFLLEPLQRESPFVVSCRTMNGLYMLLRA